MADNKEDLTRLKLPRGGVVTFWKPDELPTRRSLRIEESALSLPKGPTRQYQANLTQAKAAHPELSEDDLIEQGHVALPEYTPEEAHRISEHGLLVAVLHMKSWTKKDDVPQTVDDLIDNTDRDEFEAIRGHSQKIQSRDRGNTTAFTDESVEEQDFPYNALRALGKVFRGNRLASDDVPSWAAQQVEELRYRQLIPMTHEEYLNEPHKQVKFFLKVAELDQQIQEERAKK